MARENDLFKFKRSVKKDEVVPEQAQVILGVIHDSAGGQITRGDLIKALDGKLETKQDIARVVSFYRGPLVSEGFITIVKAEMPKAEKKAKAPAKPKAAAKAKAPAKKKSAPKKKKAATEPQPEVDQEQAA